ncbi:MAG: LamG domain-containing protein [Candidatus Pacebacteria bacterium]|nr:LamG domain-containing protein [Candidatus Paceibacterota bacterium]
MHETHNNRACTVFAADCRAVFLPLLAVFVAGANSACGLDRGELRHHDRIVFHASFDYEDVLADVAVGDRGRDSDEARYIAGLSGRALILDKESVTTYGLPGARHVTLTGQGTLLFWVQPLDWAHGAELKANPAYNRLVESRSPTGVYWCIQRMAYTNGNERFMLYLTSPRTGSMPIHRVVTWEDGEWHMLALSWNRREFAFYVDGRLVGAKCLGKPIAAEDSVPDLHFSPGMPTAIDEILVFDKQLSRDDIGAIYDAYRVPEL